MKFIQLQVAHLKKELDAAGLTTTGTKQELQQRLRAYLQAKGVDLDVHEFEFKEQQPAVEPVDVNQLLKAMQNMLLENSARMEAKFQENSARLEAKLQETSDNKTGSTKLCAG